MLDAMRQHAQSWVVKAVFLIIILVFVFYFGMSTSGDGKAIVAYVDGKPLTTREFEKNYAESIRLIKKQNPGLSEDDLQKAGFRRQVFSQMINTMLLENAAKRLNVMISPEELRAEISRIPAFQNDSRQFDKANYEAVLAANQLKPAEFEADFAQNLLMEKMTQSVTLPAFVTEQETKAIYDFARELAEIEYIFLAANDFKAGITPSQEEIAKFYEANKESFRKLAEIKVEFVELSPKALAKPEKIKDEDLKARYEASLDKYSHPDMVNARHLLIMLPQDASEADVKAAREKLAAIAPKLRKGEDLNSFISKTSEPGSIQGGELGWFPKGAMVKEFEDVVFALKKGEVSDPVRTQFGWHLIKVDDKKDAGAASFEEVKNEIRKEMAEEAASKDLSKQLDKAVDTVVAGGGIKKAADDLGLKVTVSESFSKDSPPADLALTNEALDTLFRLAKDAVTDTPLPSQDGFVLAKVLEIKPEQIPPLSEVSAEISETLVEQKALQLAKDKATELSERMKTPDGLASVLAEYKGKLKTSKPFDRQGNLQDLGPMPTLAEAAFAAKPDAWLPAPFGSSEGFVIAKLTKLLPPDPSTWARDKDRWSVSLLQSKQNEIFRAYIELLREKAKIEIVNQAILGPAAATVEN